jgi:hypothetical protein
MSSTAPSQRAQGWTVFAAVILIMAGIMRILDAFWAFDRNDETSEDLQVLLFKKDLAAYGWLWLVVGALLIAAGVGVLRGSRVARWFGIAVAAFAAISAMLWIYEFPIGALIYVSIAVLVILGLTADAPAEVTGRTNWIDPADPTDPGGRDYRASDIG